MVKFDKYKVGIKKCKKFGSKHILSYFDPTCYVVIEETIHV